MVEFNELVPDILTESGNCPEMILERNLRNASIDFLQETELWQSRVTFPSIEGQGEYPISVDGQQAVVKLTYCAINGHELLQTVPHRRFALDGMPKHYFLRDNKVHLRPFKVLRGDIELEVIFKPNRNATGIPEHIADEWFETIQQGALAKTLAMSGTPWYDPDRAIMYSQQYAIGLNAARLVGTRQNHSRIMNTRFSW
jgi:hypothetical protein